MKEASIQKLAEKIAIVLEPTLRKVIKEQLEHHISACFQSSPRRSLVYRPESFPSREFQLLFTKKLPSKIFTNSWIADENHAPLQIHLVDTSSKNVISDGRLSSIKVEIVALNGEFAANGQENWSRTEFNDSIVREREGKRPLLIRELCIVLDNGVGSLGNISFTDNSSWIRCRKFKLGVRAVSRSSIGADSIKEAVSDAFVVLDHRGESYQKHSKPSLDDPVWRLRKISKLGASRKKLESHGIKTVKDFLMHYYMNPSSLRRVLGKSVADRAWDTIVRHANDCHLDNTYYRYCGDSESVELLFNCVYKVVGVKFTGQNYQTVDSLDICQKALVDKLMQTASLNLNKLIPVLNSPAISLSELPMIEHNIPLYSSDWHYEDFSMIEQYQDEPAEKQMDFNLLDTASYPCTAEAGGYLPEDDSTSQTDQPVPVQWLDQSSFVTGNSSSVPSDEGYNWSLNSPSATFTHSINPFETLSHPNTTPWGQYNDQFAMLNPIVQSGASYQMPGNSVNVSGSRSRKAGWCKIRAAVKWKIVRRNAVARRKGKFPFSYY